MKLPQFKKFDKVEVKWMDSVGGDGWGPVRDEDTEIYGCTTVGQVYSQQADRITLIFSWDEVKRHAAGYITIPAVAIHAIRRLR